MEEMSSTQKLVSLFRDFLTGFYPEGLIAKLGDFAIMELAMPILDQARDINDYIDSLKVEDK